MGIRVSKMTIFRPSCRGDLERNFHVFEASTGWGKGRDRTAGKQRERDRVRYRTFQKRDAQALRFGSMNSITFLDAKNDDEEARMCWVNCSSRVGVKFDGFAVLVAIFGRKKTPK